MWPEVRRRMGACLEVRQDSVLLSGHWSLTVSWWVRLDLVTKQFAPLLLSNLSHVHHPQLAFLKAELNRFLTWSFSLELKPFILFSLNHWERKKNLIGFVYKSVLFKNHSEWECLLLTLKPFFTRYIFLFCTQSLSERRLTIFIQATCIKK